MYYYRSFGQDILSDFELPELEAAPQPVESAPRAISIVRGDVAVDWATMNVSRSMMCNYAIDARDHVYLSWDDVGIFRIANGSEIMISPVPTVDLGLLKVITLGAAMAVLLHQQGLVVLHGSAMEVSGRAVAFIGGKGFGKSTLAAALAQRGHRVLSDDVIAIARDEDAGYSVLPSYSQLKLWPDAAEALGHSPANTHRVTELYDKVAVRSSLLATRGIELGHVVVLGVDDELKIAKLPGQVGISQLLVHSYVSRFSDALLGNSSAQHMLAIGQIARTVGVYKLSRPVGLDLLNPTSECIEAFMAAGPVSSAIHSRT